jgi:hypothetical protein
MELVPGLCQCEIVGCGEEVFNCFMALESVFPTSSTRVAANQKTTIALSCGRFSMRIGVSGASASD